MLNVTSVLFIRGSTMLTVPRYDPGAPKPGSVRLKHTSRTTRPLCSFAVALMSRGSSCWEPSLLMNCPMKTSSWLTFARTLPGLVTSYSTCRNWIVLLRANGTAVTGAARGFNCAGLLGEAEGTPDTGRLAAVSRIRLGAGIRVQSPREKHGERDCPDSTQRHDGSQVGHFQSARCLIRRIIADRIGCAVRARWVGLLVSLLFSCMGHPSLRT